MKIWLRKIAFFDQAGNTLTAWSGNPRGEYICEETGDETYSVGRRMGCLGGRRPPINIQFSPELRNYFFMRIKGERS
jgi:hypothetical protein